MHWSSVLVCWALLSLGGAAPQSATDLTLKPDASGRGVVEAVIDKLHASCAFPRDRLFLLRLADVESDYGTDPSTYRQDYHGGIWQVDESMFEEIKGCPPPINTTCALLKDSMQVDWSQVTWQDLRKPLLSGMAAFLYVLQRRGLEPVPGDLVEQAKVWATVYRPGRTVSEFHKDDFGQLPTRPVDMAILLDSSRSISTGDFGHVLQFLVNLTRELDVSTDGAHVALVSFSNSATVEFKLTEHLSHASLEQAIQAVPYRPGFTNTAEAIRKTNLEVFGEQNGARADVSHVALLITDGRSNRADLTLEEAKQAKLQGIRFFVIGVGQTWDAELAMIASEPNCTHVDKLDSYSEISSLLYEIQHSTQRAPVQVPLPSGHSDLITRPIPPSGTSLTSKLTPDPGDKDIYIVTQAACGTVSVYVSETDSFPSASVHQLASTASPGHPAVLHVTRTPGQPDLYVTYLATRLQQGGCDNATYQTAVTTTQPNGAEVVCRELGLERKCTKVDLLSSQYKDLLCEDPYSHLANPCTDDSAAGSVLPHPQDSTKFLLCDLAGNVYVSTCPPGHRYHPESRGCGAIAHTPGHSQGPLPAYLTNPCTPAHLKAGHWSFAFPGSSSRYIACDVWGHAEVKVCPTGQSWNSDNSTCVSPPGLGQGQSNPCMNRQPGFYSTYLPYPGDQAKFIQCQADGTALVKHCFAGTYFDSRYNICIMP